MFCYNTPTMRLTTALILFLVMALGSGCATVMEVPKAIWGSSTRALEKARSNAISRTFQCSYNDCFDAVLRLGEKPEPKTEDAKVDESTKEESDAALGSASITPKTNTTVVIFIKNRAKQHIVVLGIPGSIDTTEGGIFFTPMDGQQVKIEISSLSTSAKETLADIVFNELGKQYTEVK